MIADHGLVFGRCRNKEPHSFGILLCRVVVVGYEKDSFLCKRYTRSYHLQRAKYLTPNKIYGDNSKKTKKKKKGKNSN